MSHSVVHSVAVGGNPASVAERTFAGLIDEQMRVRPRDDLNSLAWIMWHIARIEDIMLNTVFSARDQVFDDEWKSRLKIVRPDFGIGMSRAEVAELSRLIALGARRDYRDAVGRRERAAALGAFGTRKEGVCQGVHRPSARGGVMRGRIAPFVRTLG